MRKVLMMFSLAAALGIAVMTLTGCGESQPPVNIDKAPFEKAIAQYCKTRNFGMKIKEFVSCATQTDSAVAVCKMQEADGLYGVSVKWEFKFKKTPDGQWEVTVHDAK